MRKDCGNCANHIRETNQFSDECEKCVSAVLKNGEHTEPSHWKAKQQTNGERIQSANYEWLEQFLCSITYNGETPWSRQFYEKFCNDCPAPEYRLDDGRYLCLHECDLNGGNCPHGTDIAWWLKQPFKDDESFLKDVNNK